MANEKNTGFLVTVRKFDAHRWCIQRGKSRWFFTLPEEQTAFDAQIVDQFFYAHKLEGQ